MKLFLFMQYERQSSHTIKREGQYIQPTGADKLMAGDRLPGLSGNEEELHEALDMLSEK